MVKFQVWLALYFNPVLVQRIYEVSDFVELEDRYNHKENKMVLTTGEIAGWL